MECIVRARLSLARIPSILAVGFQNKQVDTQTAKQVAKQVAKQAMSNGSGKKLDVALDAAVDAGLDVTPDVAADVASVLSPRLALDAMGGDKSPEMVVEGAQRAAERNPECRFIFFGRQAQLRPLLKARPFLKERSEIRHTDDVIKSDLPPAQALRHGRESSLGRAIRAVAEGEADCVISAGNTGALMALSKFQLRMLPGILRPAICCYFINRNAETVLLDSGANVDSSKEMLVQFALMGDAFARTGLGVANPRVGLLNIGAEAIKGRLEIRQAAIFFKENPKLLSYCGFVEGDDLLSGRVDVVVADGFSGNIALKAMEGTANAMLLFLQEMFRSSVFAKLGYFFARNALRRLQRRIDPRNYNGAVLLGLNGLAIKSHGGTDALGFANAISLGVNVVRRGFMARIKEQLRQTQSPTPTQAQQQNKRNPASSTTQAALHDAP